MLSPNLEYNSDIPLYEQVYSYIKEEIKKGYLKKDEKLPSKRNFAQNIGVSTNTITSAYNILIDEGYIYSVERKGYFVSNIEHLATLNKEKQLYTKREFEGEKEYKYNLMINTIDLKEFPIYTWRRTINTVMTDETDKWIKTSEPQGLYSLRYEINRYLRQSRDVKTNEENIIIGSGTDYLLQLLLYILSEDTIFSLENPGYLTIKKQLELNNRKVLPLALDNEGASVKELNKSSGNIVIVTPSHQFPTGVIMPINRRLQLLYWANKENNRYIIEDDYDSEFKYYGRPIPALKSLDNRDKVIYIGNFSKSIYSSLRISYMVLPNKLLNIYDKVLPEKTCPVSSISQLALAKFMNEGYFERHLNRSRNIYEEKRNTCIKYIENNWDKNKCKIIDSQAGLHFILEINNGLSEEELVKRGKEKGIFIQGIKEFYFNDKKPINPQIIIGYGGLKIKEINKVFKILKNIWKC